MTRLYALMGVALLVVLAGGMVSHGAVTGTSTIVRTTTVGVGPGDIQVDEQSGRAFVINMGSNTVSVLDTHTGALVQTVDMGRATVPAHRPTPRGPFALTIDARAGRVVVADISGGVSTLDARSGRLLRTVPSGFWPEQVAVDTRTGHAVVLDYAGDESSAGDRSNGTISIIDTRSGHLLRHIHAQGRPYAVVVDEHSGRAFVRSDGPAGTRLVNVIDMTSGRLVRTVTCNNAPQPGTGVAPTCRLVPGSVTVLDATR